jgi:hypothetical protein
MLHYCLYFNGSNLDILFALKYNARSVHVFSDCCPPLIFNHTPGAWLFSSYLYYNPVRGLWYADQLFLLNSQGAGWIHDRNLLNFWRVGKRYDTLGRLEHQHAVLTEYSRAFTERSPRFSGRRLTFVSNKLQSLLAENRVRDRILGRGAETVQVILFDQVHIARANNTEYSALLIEHEHLVAEADRVFVVYASLEDSIKKIEKAHLQRLYLQTFLCTRTCFFNTFIR